MGPMQVQKVMMQQKEAPILIKQGSLDGKGRKEKNRQAAAAASKGPTREEVFERVDSILDDMISASKECSAKDKTEADEAKEDEVNDNQEVESSDKEMTTEEKDQESTLSKDDSECLAIEA